MHDSSIDHRWWLTSAASALMLILALLPAVRGQQPAAEAELLPRPAFRGITNSIGLELVLIRRGKFMMGSSDKEDGRFTNEGPQHPVRITRSFYLGANVVTQGEFRLVMGYNPSSHKLGADYPVDQTTWKEAVAFCEALSARPAEKAARRVYRLPTEAEWEYACRARTTTAFHVGDALAPKQANVDRSVGRPTPAGSYAPNAWGLYDMHGNVWQWCADWYGSDHYTADAEDNPTGPELGSTRVIRGGSWDSDTVRCRSAARDLFTPTHRFHDIGFRVVCIVTKP